jgi:hypothetical protein
VSAWEFEKAQQSLKKEIGRIRNQIAATGITQKPLTRLQLGNKAEIA